MQVKFHNSVLHFDKVMTLLSLLIYLQSILDVIFQIRSINSILMEGFSSNLTQMFTPTRQCTEPILPLYQLCQGQWWGYESHSAIVLVYYV